MTGRLAVIVAVIGLGGCAEQKSPAAPAQLAPGTITRLAEGGSVTKRDPNKLFAPPDANTPLGDPPKLLSDEQLREGWVTLFDGKTLFGWVANSETPWSVNEGEIVSPDGTPGLLLTTSEWRDYEFRCEAWLGKGGNSGVFLRTVTHPTSPAKDCMEFNLCDTHESFPTGSLVARAKVQKDVKTDGDWHSVRVVVQGEKFTADIDGQTVLESSSPEFAKTGGSRIGLQQNGGAVRFRNVFLKPLETKPLATAGSIDAWRVSSGKDLHVDADEDGIRIRGEGVLETTGQFGDFVLQFEAKLNAKDVNSGVFFRAEPGTEQAPSNGYELQLQNTVTGGDRMKPADYGDGFGTGAIFRRQRARYVNAEDEQWFAVTLNAKGNHFATWVNGLQVADFTDERKPDKNPRQGRRDEPGHISLQGHDPNTNASFRNLRVAPLP